MASSRINVEVTEPDIRRAMVSNSYKCVVAQAIARTVPDATAIEVDVQTIRFSRPSLGNRYVYLTPYTVQGYIVAFDAGDSIEPFRFTLRNPQIVKRRTRSDPGKPIASDSVRNDDTPVSIPIERDQMPPVTEQDPIGDLGPDYVAPHESYQKAISKATNSTDRLPPKAFKSKSRRYGMRVLRYNETPEIRE